MIRGANGKVRLGTADRDRFADGRYELERSFARHFKIEHDGRQTNYTTLIDSHQVPNRLF